MLKNIIKTVLFTLLIVFMFYLTCYKPSIRYATTDDLDAIYGIKKDGVIIERIYEYIKDNPNLKVTDLKEVKGVDGMIIDQLKERWR